MAFDCEFSAGEAVGYGEVDRGCGELERDREAALKPAGDPTSLCGLKGGESVDSVDLESGPAVAMVEVNSASLYSGAMAARQIGRAHV